MSFLSHTKKNYSFIHSFFWKTTWSRFKKQNERKKGFNFLALKVFVPPSRTCLQFVCGQSNRIIHPNGPCWPSQASQNCTTTPSLLLKWSPITNCQHVVSTYLVNIRKTNITDLRVPPKVYSCLHLTCPGKFQHRGLLLSRQTTSKLALTLYFLCSCSLRISKYVQDPLCNPTHPMLSSWSPITSEAPESPSN